MILMNTIGGTHSTSQLLFVVRCGSNFSGKERDTESGNDYFGARYYSFNMGRFMSPDWSAKEEPIPYAKLDNPQSLNLYAYVMNNPMTRFDADGHAGGCSGDQAAVCKSILDAMGKGMDAAEAMGKAAQQFAKKAGSYFYATGFK